jgi:hypothetical protein
MFRDILRSVFSNVRRFGIVWLLVLLANQLFIFRGCFAPYCIAAAVPHTLLIAALINFFGFYGGGKLRHSAVPAARSVPSAPSVPPAPSVSSVQSSQPPMARPQTAPRALQLALLALIAICIALAVFSLKRDAPVPALEPALQPAPTPAPAAGHHQEAAPVSSADPSLIRYCVAQGIRLEGMRELAVLDTAQKRSRFDAMTADFDTRCAAQLAPSDALDAAVVEVEPYRRALKFEGLRQISGSD